MKGDDSAAERLRARFTSPPHDVEATGDCPDPDRFWRAARAELPWSETEALVDHVASCPACTVAWRMAREQARADVAQAMLESRERSVPRWTWVRYAAAAAVVVAAAGLAFQRWSRPTPEAPALRATGSSAIRSLIPDGSELPRAAFRLRWTPGPAGTRYSIQVTDEKLSAIAEAFALELPEFRVPETALADLAPGARVLWQVKAVFPEGTRVTSDTFLARVAGPRGP
jgi:hypothetical protein